MRGILLLAAVSMMGLGCGDDGGGDPNGITLEHCELVPVPATAGAGGQVTRAALSAGTHEAVLPIPIGSALGSYTSRAGFLGSTGTVDLRDSHFSGNFNPSIGIESAPRVKALALRAGGETVVILKLDLGFPYEGMVFDLEQRLGSEYSGKILISTSHSHSSWGHYTAHSAYMMGAGVMRERAYTRFLSAMEDTARAAVAALRPAKIGVFTDGAFDPQNQITRDRRGENDALMGGSRKDDRLFMIRIDGTDDAPIAMIPVYGVHGTLNDDDNSLASTDVTGALERTLEERFDQKVLVMHLQGAGADVSPTPHGGIDCAIKPGGADDPCFAWNRAEGNARVAADTMMAAYQAAGAGMQSEVELEMLTRSIELGPDPATFTLRDGALSYAPFDYAREEADGVLFNPDGTVASPIDEFNAPVGAGLCESDEIMFAAALIPGTYQLPVYGSCARVGAMSDIFEILLDTRFESDDTHPMCQSTRTVVSALRIGDYLIGTLPGELSVMLADYIRSKSPVAADKTILLGYSQGETGYLLTPEDWLQGGYESSINLWGPLEGEYTADRLIELFALATSAEREDAAAGGVDRFATPAVTDDGIPVDDPAPMAGTVPATVPDRVWTRTGVATSAQPDTPIRRVSGIARFVWIGDDPLVHTPVVTLQRETSPGSGLYADVTRRSGRLVQDTAIVLAYTPQPLRRDGDQPQTHYFAAEWQAVPHAGAIGDAGEDLDSMGARAGMPLGMYRFRVTGKAYEIYSDPFEVIEASLGASGSVVGTVVNVAVSIHADKGWRLLDLQEDSNRAVPVREGSFTVELTLSGGGSRVFTNVAIDTSGVLSVDGEADTASATSVMITDAYGNSATAGL